jgi:hypothetical protein
MAPNILIQELATEIAELYLQWASVSARGPTSSSIRRMQEQALIDLGPPVGRAIEEAFRALGQDVIDGLPLKTAQAILKSLNAIAEYRGLDRTALAELGYAIASVDRPLKRRGVPWTVGRLPTWDDGPQADGRRTLRTWTRWFYWVKLEATPGVLSRIAKRLPRHGHHGGPLNQCGCRRIVRDGVTEAAYLLGVSTLQ